MKKRLATMLAVLAAAAFGSWATAAGAAAPEPYVPFVTDFPRPAAAPVEDGYVPFVTDFPRPAVAPVEDGSASGIDWADAGIAGGIGAAVAALLAGSALALARRGRPAPS